jgi:hypothetical protein
MNPIAITVVVSCAFACAVAIAVLLHGKQHHNSGLESRWQKVDMEAFLNLADPSEETYLRRNLSATEFAGIQRQRVRVMWQYLGRLSANSKLMMQAAQKVQHHGSPEQMQEATRLVGAATQMRMLIFAVDAWCWGSMMSSRRCSPRPADRARPTPAHWPASPGLSLERTIAAVR